MIQAIEITAGLESSGPRGSRLSEALGPPFSRTARYKFRSAIFFMAGLESGGARGSRLTQHDSDAPERLGINAKVGE